MGCLFSKCLKLSFVACAKGISIGVFVRACLLARSCKQFCVFTKNPYKVWECIVAKRAQRVVFSRFDLSVLLINNVESDVTSISGTSRTTLRTYHVTLQFQGLSCDCQKVRYFKVST